MTTRPGGTRPIATLLLAWGLSWTGTSLVLGQGGPPPPPPPPPFGPLQAPLAPPQNPVTPAKVVLGKMLFWDEQLSSDDTVACGTCHLPEFGGSDGRSQSELGRHPGFDGVFGTADDGFGSPGVPAEECGGDEFEDPLFGWERQVTGRKSPSAIAAGYAPDLFWDGRATSQFLDPETAVEIIPSGGALESQAVGPILSSVEMACATRTWEDVKSKLESATPMVFALALTPDLENALLTSPDYPSLFLAAFGSPEITAARIAMAIASYERILVPNQTPFDAFLAGVPGALSPPQQQGLNLFNQNCLPCHGGPLLTDHEFHNIGVRPIFEDLGRQAETGLPQDAGRFKTPTLRNVALRAPYFHNGGKATLLEVVNFYNVGGEFFVGQDPLIEPLGLAPGQRQLIASFMATALTDPRVEAGLPPFDRPELRPYFRRGDANHDNVFDLADPISTLGYLFSGGALDCLDAADSNDDGELNVADVVSALARIFQGAPPLPAPGDIRRGPDPTPDPLHCSP